jgi:hypothetical protein
MRAESRQTIMFNVDETRFGAVVGHQLRRAAIPSCSQACGRWSHWQTQSPKGSNVYHLNIKSKLLTAALLSAGLISTPAWSQSAMPAASAADATAAPATRAEVKDDLKAAQKAGEIPQGEGGVTKQAPKGGAVKSSEMKGEMSRAEVKAEAKRARAAGEIPQGQAGTTADRPKGGAKVAKGSATTRAEVKAEAKRAEQAGEIPKGEASMPALKPKS